MKNDNWQIIENEFDVNTNAADETLFSLGNGYFGTRGTFEEGLAHHSKEGNFINGFYESEPIIYGEKLYGFAENKQTMLNIANGKIIKLSITNEPFDLLTGKIINYERKLDMKEGVLYRKVEWESPTGKIIKLESERLVLHCHRHLSMIRYKVTPINFSGTIKLFSAINGEMEEQGSEHDPRLGASFQGEVLLLKNKIIDNDYIVLQQTTQNTNLTLSCGIKGEFVNQNEYDVKIYDHDLLVGNEYLIEAKQGKPIEFNKYIVYYTSLDTEQEKITLNTMLALENASNLGFEALKQEQQKYLEEFWYTSDVIIEGNDTLHKSIRLSIFHILQSTGKEGKTAIGAKGLTGEGYEGHFFWDTEIYILPLFLYNHPEISRKLIEFRYNTLDKARQRAREMSHSRGALFAWRTINGDECSPFFPAGTAQYHINAAVALAIEKYFDATEDVEFMKDYGAEILFETARLWFDLGDFIETQNNQFCINDVTGPDEYTCIVDNNAYTNYMAKENLRFASEISTWLKKNYPDSYQKLAEKISLEDDEADGWKKAAENMYLPYDEKLGIIPQDDTFLKKAAWDFENTPKENYPLLLNYHPLVIYRYQVCKQPDLILAQFLLHDQFSLEQKKHDYDYYEKITTHDSSLSDCIFGIMAAEIGYKEKSYEYFIGTATMDLENKKGNTKDGVHAANMAGTWMSIVYGFAGMRVSKELSFNPIIPDQWDAYEFRVLYKHRLINIRITHDNVDIKLLKGNPISIKVSGNTLSLK